MIVIQVVNYSYKRSPSCIANDTITNLDVMANIKKVNTTKTSQI